MTTERSVLISIDLYTRRVPGVQLGRLAGLHDHARQHTPERILRKARGIDERIEIDAGLDAHGMHHMDEILGRDVADCARRERAAAEPTDRALEIDDAEFKAGERVGQAEPACIVEMQAD